MPVLRRKIPDEVGLCERLQISVTREIRLEHTAAVYGDGGGVVARAAEGKEAAAMVVVAMKAATMAAEAVQGAVATAVRWCRPIWTRR